MAWLFSGKSKVQNTSEMVIDFLTGNVMDDEAFTGGNSMKNSDIFTAVKILSGDVASSLVKSDNPDIEKLLNVQANELTTGFTLKRAIMVNLLLFGNAYVGIVRDEVGRPIKLKLIESQSVSVLYDSDKFDMLYSVMWEGERLEIRKENMLHFKVLTDDGLMGVSPLQALQKEIALQENGNKIMLRFFKKGAFAAAILKVKQGVLDTKQKKTIKNAWEEANNGSDNSSGTLVIDESMDYIPLQMDTKVLDLVNNNVYSTKQIAKVFGIPLNRFGMELVSSSDGEIDLQYVKSTLRPYFIAVEEELNMKLGSRQQFDYSHLLEQSEKQKAEVFKLKTESYKALVEMGVYNAIEIKELIEKGVL